MNPALRELHGKIINLIGSSKFQKVFSKWNAILSMQGNIVLAPAFFYQDKGEAKGLPVIDPKRKATLQEVAKAKVIISQITIVLNVNNYIGEGTKELIALALSQKKEVMYLEVNQA